MGDSLRNYDGLGNDGGTKETIVCQVISELPEMTVSSAHFSGYTENSTV